ncbi:GTPase [Streptomyces sp. NPDC055099]
MPFPCGNPGSGIKSVLPCRTCFPVSSDRTQRNAFRPPAASPHWRVYKEMLIERGVVVVQWNTFAGRGQLGRALRKWSARFTRRSARLLGAAPTVVFLGKRGVGKSSTMNSLFGLALKSDAARECTTSPKPVRVRAAHGRRRRVVDMPGIAANLETAARYRSHYEYWMARADVVVWLTQADVRSYTQDQKFFRSFGPLLAPGARVVLAVSKFDTQDPAVGLPGAVLDEALHAEKLRDVREQLTPYVPPGRAVRLVPYSAVRRWNLGRLLAAMTEAETAGTSGTPNRETPEKTQETEVTPQ